MNIKITGTGSCIPKNTKLNSGFSENSFYDSNGVHIESSNSEIIEKGIPFSEKSICHRAKLVVEANRGELIGNRQYGKRY